ncbi:MurR/RpiR family transcriptional regulator [Lentibacillus sp. Marseille-P4043]|uniref:MurR/RpiR family transcriptional regulator n=1 Tax=Lentibacillus sp. Marseille-P4043 TaxID=2040293 RepID=UPI000D0AF640|nr:MurR/RpiR family transcriptional regulator [Lentibacillus sp. Marseille-P4043]
MSNKDFQGNQKKPTVIMEQNKPIFTKSEQKIYTYINENMDKVLYDSLTELSEASGVAEATVLRFFRKLGFKGFQDFKFLLAQERTMHPNHDNDGTFIEKIRNNIVQAINDSSEIIEMDTLQQCVDIIDSSNDVVIFGVGSSGIACHDMHNRLMRIGKHAEVITDPHFQVMRASTMTKETVVIAVSLSGSTKDIYDSVEIAKASNAAVIALTNYVKSPLTRLSDHVLLSSAKENPLDSGSLVSKISQLYIIDLICTGLTMKNVEKAKEIKMKISENAANKLY